MEEVLQKDIVWIVYLVCVAERNSNEYYCCYNVHVAVEM